MTNVASSVNFLTFSQTTPSNIWQISHQQNSDVFTLYCLQLNNDGSYSPITPISINIVDLNNIQLNFTNPVNGITNMMFGIGLIGPVINITPTPTVSLSITPSLSPTLTTTPTISVTPSNTNSNTINAGLVGYWKFDEGSGTIALDSSGNNNTGTLINSPSWVTGKYGSALKFLGINQSVVVNNSTSLANLYENGLSITVWINPSGTNSLGRIVDKDNNSVGWFLALTGTQIIFQSDQFPSVEPSRNSTAQIPQNQWSHVAVTWDGSINGSNIHIYVNGTLADGTAFNGAGSAGDDTTIPLTIGNREVDEARGFNGSIDEVRIYNRILSALDIATIYSNSSSSPISVVPSVTPTPSINLTSTPSNISNSLDFNPPYPRTAVYAIGGDQSYGYGTYGSYPNVVTNALGGFTAIILGGTWESWATSTRTKESLVAAVKSGTGYSGEDLYGNPFNITSSPNPPKVFLYLLPTESYAPSPLVGNSVTTSLSPLDDNATLTKLESEYNFWGYVTGPVPSTQYTVDLNEGSSPSYAAGESTNGVQVCYMIDYTNGKPFAGYTSLGERPSELIAKYAYYFLLSQDRTTDSRFANISINNAAPNADGIFFDNRIRSFSDVSATIDGNRSGVSSTNGYDTTLADWMSAGDNVLYAEYQKLVNGQKYSIGNYTDYAISKGTGIAPYSMNQVLHGGVLESMIGYANSIDSYGSSTALFNAVNTGLSRVQSPQIVMVGARWLTSGQPSPIGGYPPNTASGYYQMMRYGLSFCCIMGVYCAFQSASTEYAVSPVTYIEWFDEYNNAGNINPYTGYSNGWLGQPITGTTGTQGGIILPNSGNIGVYAREFAGGLVLWNPGGNGVQTITIAQLTAAGLGSSGTWQYITGKQNPSINNGSIVTTSITLGNSASDRDGLLFLRV